MKSTVVLWCFFSLALAKNETCFHDGFVYNNGEIWKSNCEICHCGTNDVHCVPSMCYSCQDNQEENCCNSECQLCDKTNSYKCVICQNTFLEQDGVCVDSCSVGYFNSGDRRCIPCHTTCADCLGSSEFQCTRCNNDLLFQYNECVIQCGKGYFKQNNKCHLCPKSCDLCSSADVCVECTSGYVLHLGQCIEHCPSGYLKTNDKCTLCSDNCTECLIMKNKEICIQCANDSVLSNGRCVETCPAGHYLRNDTHICEACHPQCYHCQGGRSNQCVSCRPLQYFSQGYCLDAVCPDGFYANSEIECLPCKDKECRRCNGPLSNQCTSCDRTLVLFGTGNVSCLLDCPLGFYKSQENYTCTACSTGCATCTSSTHESCISCHSPLFLQKGECVNQCQIKLFLNQTASQCQDCHITCESCNGAARNDCLSCGLGNTLQNGQCVSDCGTNMYTDQIGKCQNCPSNCSECIYHFQIGRVVCINCQNATFFNKDGDCVSSCETGWFNRSQICVECSTVCKTCDKEGPFGCLSCAEGLYLTTQGSCLDTCPLGYHKDLESASCISCESNCEECDLDGNCTKCISRKALHDGKCLNQCPSMHYFDQLTQHCVQCHWSCKFCVGPSFRDCLVCNPGLLLQDSRCVSMCSGGYFPEGTSCLKCSIGCRKCTNKFCRNCFAPLWLQEGKCLTDCSVPGFRKEIRQSKCIRCSTNCSSCNSQKCTHCTFSMYLFNDKCLSKCPENYISLTDTRQCISKVTLMDHLGFLQNITVTENDDYFFRISENFNDNSIVVVVNYLTPNCQLLRLEKNSILTELRNDEMFLTEDIKRHNVFLRCSGKERKRSALLEVTAHSYLSDSAHKSVHIDIVTSMSSHDILLVKRGGKAPLSDIFTEELLIINQIPNSGYLECSENICIPFKIESPENVSYIHNGNNVTFDAILLTVSKNETRRNIMVSVEIINVSDNESVELTSSSSVDESGFQRDVPASFKEHGDFRSYQAVNNNIKQRSGKKVDHGDSHLLGQLSITVMEGQALTISTDHLSYSAKGIKAKDIVYRITRPLNANEGDFMHLDQPGKKVTSFTQEDINTMKLIYMSPPSIFGGDSGKVYYFKFQVIVGLNISKEEDFYIRVLPKMEPHIVNLFPEVLVTQGASAEIDPLIFEVAGLDLEEENINYAIVESVHFGSLQFQYVNGKTVYLVTNDKFSGADLRKGKLIYKHNGTSLKGDSFEVMVSDGHEEVTNKILLVISPQVHKQSQEHSNTITRLRVVEGEKLILTSAHLSMNTILSSKEDVLFTVVMEPIYGTILLKEDDELIDIVELDQFNGEDALQSHVYYYANMEIGSEPISDVMSFNITSIDDNFHCKHVVEVTIDPVNNYVPLVVVNGDIQVTEGSSVNLHDDLLSVLDLDSSGENLVIHIVRKPQHGYLIAAGTDNWKISEDQVSEFKYQDLLSGYITYIQNDHKEKEIPRDSFSFKISDGQNTSPVTNVNITIQLTNDEAPLVITEPIHVPLLGNAVLNKTALNITDLDTTPEHIIIRLTSMPKSGFLYQDGNKLSLHDQFFYKNVLDGSINYENVGLHEKDFFVINVSDGMYSRSIQVSVFVNTTKYNVLPIVKIDRGLTVSAGTSKMITVKDLLTESSGSREEDILFYLLNITTGGRLEIWKNNQWQTLHVGNTFSQYDISHNYLRYSHIKSSQSPEEWFTYNVENEKKQIILNKIFRLHILAKEQRPPVIIQNEELANLMKENYGEKIFIPEEKKNVIPSIHFATREIVVKEDVGTTTLELIREGSDLQSESVVWCATKSTDTVSAKPGEDYKSSTTKITFEKGQKRATCPVTILDDDMDIIYEGLETFLVVLRQPDNAVISYPNNVTFTIDDRYTDASIIEFEVDEVVVLENSLTAKLPIVRTGDLSQRSQVECQVEERTARRNTDFLLNLKYPNTVLFETGMKNSDCEVQLTDDDVYEGLEEFTVHLRTSVSNENKENPRLGSRTIMRVKIDDKEDKPRISFTKTMWKFRTENLINTDGNATEITIAVERLGDLTAQSRLSIRTQDDTAVAGLDYVPFSDVIIFNSGEKVKPVHLNVYLTGKSCTFFVLLDEIEMADYGEFTISTISLNEKIPSRITVFPAPPVIMSLIDYSQLTNKIVSEINLAYPVVCVHSCDKKYPQYFKTSKHCNKISIDENSLTYTWEVSAPLLHRSSEMLSHYHLLKENTIFADVQSKVLDNMYFTKKFQLRCSIQPSSGLKTQSDSFQIDEKNGKCLPHLSNIKSFKAEVAYVDSSNKFYPNTIHVRVVIKHEDGMIPLISTQALYHPKTLLVDVFHRSQHFCSNLNFGQGFLSEDKPAGFELNEILFNSSLINNNTLALYRHLNMKKCEWTFDAWFTMSELIDKCKGKMSSHSQKSNEGTDHLSLRVPLYVSYLMPSPPIGWTSIDHHTELEVTLTYNNLLWTNGIETLPSYAAEFQVIRTGIDSEGHLVLEFQTKAEFRGKYVLSHPTSPNYHSYIQAPQELNLHLHLELVWSQNTFDGPKQLWKGTSDISLDDYTGLYIVYLIPCSLQYTSSGNVSCVAKSPVEFQIPVTVQQVLRPLPLKYTLNTDFQLMNDKKLFMMNPMFNENETFNGSYKKGDTVFGRVLWHPSQDLQEAYQLQILRLYACTGIDGQLPYYDPTGEVYGNGQRYGCMDTNGRLKYRFLILDRENPNAIDKNYHHETFGAKFVEDLLDYQLMNNYSGIDGFMLRIDPLFAIGSGHQWFLQVLYNIGPSETHRQKRHSTHEKSFGLEKGTNMISLKLHYSSAAFNTIYTPVILSGLFILLIIIITGFLIFMKLKKTHTLTRQKELRVNKELVPLNNKRENETKTNNMLSSTLLQVSEL